MSIQEDFRSLRDNLETSGPYIPPSIIITQDQVKSLEYASKALQDRAEKAEAERDELTRVLEDIDEHFRMSMVLTEDEYEAYSFSVRKK